MNKLKNILAYETEGEELLENTEYYRERLTDAEKEIHAAHSRRLGVGDFPLPDEKLKQWMTYYKTNPENTEFAALTIADLALPGVHQAGMRAINMALAQNKALLPYLLPII